MITRIILNGLEVYASKPFLYGVLTKYILRDTMYYVIGGILWIYS